MNYAHASLAFAFEGRTVRTVLIGGEPWFVAKDIAEVLGYSGTHEMTKRLDDDEKSTLQIAGLGARTGGRGATVISEPGVYEALFGSQKAKAKEFRRWLKREVLPSIRRRGVYFEGQQRIRAELIDALAENIREKALPALQEYDRQTEHLHWIALTKPEEYRRRHQLAVDAVALDFDLPRSLVAALTSQGLSAVTA